MKSVLLENIHPEATRILSEKKHNVQTYNKSFTSTELKTVLSDVEIVGIRSATRLTRDIINECDNLKAIGCFSVGFDSVDIQAAAEKGIPVFNSPFSSTRSVAELIIAQIINLSRKVGDNLCDLKSNLWNKSAEGCYEIRGKNLFCIGYGNIGSTVGIMAENLGMRVIFYDIEPKLAYGNAKPVADLESGLAQADFVTLHVTLTELTKGMIDAKRISQMKPGSYLLNASRGNVVVINDVVAALKSKHLAGFYADVFPYEPKFNGKWLELHYGSLPSMPNKDGKDCKDGKDNKDGIHHQLKELLTLPNVIITPHIGGSTMESQHAIAEDVTNKLLNFVSTGSTIGCVNLPQISLPDPRRRNFTSSIPLSSPKSPTSIITTTTSTASISSTSTVTSKILPADSERKSSMPFYYRILNFHNNVPGVIRDISSCLGDFNIVQQNLATFGNIGYCIMDIELIEFNEKILNDCLERIKSLPQTITCIGLPFK